MHVSEAEFLQAGMTILRAPCTIYGSVCTMELGSALEGFGTVLHTLPQYFATNACLLCIHHTELVPVADCASIGE